MTGRRRDLHIYDGPHGWEDRAACLEYDPEDWFVKGPVPAAIKKICGGCEVRQECLDFAMAVEGDHTGNSHREGIFGGLSGRERGRLAGHMRRINNDFPLPTEETA